MEKRNAAIDARIVRALIKKTLRETTNKAFASHVTHTKLEYYDEGWKQAAQQILNDFEAAVGEHGFE